MGWHYYFFTSIATYLHYFIDMAMPFVFIFILLFMILVGGIFILNISAILKFSSTAVAAAFNTSCFGRR